MPDLTERERQIVERVARGDATKTIAADLRTSEQAVKAHLTRLFAKFGVANRAGLVSRATHGKRDSTARRMRGLRSANATLRATNAGLARELAALRRGPRAGGR